MLWLSLVPPAPVGMQRGVSAAVKPSLHTLASVQRLTHAEQQCVGLPSALGLGLSHVLHPPHGLAGCSMLHSCTLHFWGMLCLGNAGDHGSARLRHYLSGKNDQHGAAAVSQGQPDTGVVGKAISTCPVQWAPMGGAGPGATADRGRGSCTCLGGAARVAVCWGWALLP